MGDDGEGLSDDGEGWGMMGRDVGYWRGMDDDRKGMERKLWTGERNEGKELI